MYLLDTNIFLEIILQQSKSETCKRFILDNPNRLNISDFSLHSIGVILFRQHKDQHYRLFVDDVLPFVQLRSLAVQAYRNLIALRQATGLDFDDSYQGQIALDGQLTLVTLDADFKKAPQIPAMFL